MLREIPAVGRAAVLSIALTLAVSACGIKGPLKLPPAPPAAPSAPDAGSAPQPVPDEGTPGKKP
jgi:predicted small lipoprotein YifL